MNTKLLYEIYTEFRRKNVPHKEYDNYHASNSSAYIGYSVAVYAVLALKRDH